MNSKLDQITPFQRLLLLLDPYRREIRYIFLYALVAGLISLSLPLGIQAIIGLIAGGSISASWGLLVLFVILGALFSGALLIMQRAITEYLQRRIYSDAALDFAVRFPQLNLEELRNEHLPEVVNRFFDVISIQKGIPKILIDGSAASLQIILGLLLLSVYHPTFVLFSLGLLLVLAILFYWTAPKGIETSLKESKEKYKLAYWLEEVGRTVATFKLAGTNRFAIEKADSLVSSYLDARAKHWRILLIQFISGLFFRVLVIGGYLILGSLLVMNNEINLGQFVGSEILVIFIVDAVEKLVILHETLYDVITATEKLGEVTDLPLERTDGLQDDQLFASGPFSLEARNLCYQFAEDDHPALKNINFHFKPGDRVAIAGYGGSGKSTLMQILSILKRDFTGTLLINGLPKQSLHLRTLRKYIGDLSSQEDIFKGTILQNIVVGREISLDKVLRTVEAIGLNDFLRSKPEGLNFIALPGGKNLPGNIKTKILVARAIIDNAGLLVLEEPVANLNFRDRERIARHLTDPNQPWTMVCVTEDALLASLCNRVLILREGQIVFDGTFEQVRETEHYNRVFRSNQDFD